MLAILKAQVRRINSSIIGSERGKTMITDSFDNKTEPIFTLKDFYGERRKNHEKIADIFKELHFPYDHKETDAAKSISWQRPSHVLLYF